MPGYELRMSLDSDSRKPEPQSSFSFKSAPMRQYMQISSELAFEAALDLVFAMCCLTWQRTSTYSLLFISMYSPPVDWT